MTTCLQEGQNQRLLAPNGLSVSHLKELLDYIVPKHVRHQLVRRLQDFAKHHLSLGGRGPLQLLLDEPGRAEGGWRLIIALNHGGLSFGKIESYSDASILK